MNPRTWAAATWIAETFNQPESAATSVAFTFVGSEVCPGDCFHLRRALVGGTLSRNWVSWVRGGTRYVVSFRHQGSGANPVTWETALAGATHAYCDLASGARTAAQVATAFAATAAALDGGTWVPVGAGVSSSGASSPLVAGDMDETTNATRGKWGMQRDLGWLDGSTSNGNMGATGGVHVPSPGTGRVLGLYIRADGGGNIRLGLGRGPAYAADPGPIDVLAQGVATAVDNNQLGVVLFSEPIAIDAADSLWIIIRGEASQLLRFRDVANGGGDLIDSEFLIWSALTGNPATAYGATIDLGGGGGPFDLRAHVGLIYELPTSGAYRNNAIRTWWGYQGAATAGTFDATDPADMVDETVTFRAPIATTLRTGSLVQIRQAVGARSAGDDLGVGLYDEDPGDIGQFPHLVAPPLLQSLGPFGVSAANQYNTHMLASPQSLSGIEALGIAYNCGRAGGAAATTLQFLYNEDAGGLPNTNHWLDDGRAWSDWVDEGSYGDPQSGTTPTQRTEYQTRTSNGSTMPAGDPTDAWPNPFQVDSSGTPDAAPLNVPRGAFLIVCPGITAS